MIIALAIAGLWGDSVSAAEEAGCAANGITVRNATMLDLWYRQDGGACTIWIHEHLVTVGPEERFEIFSDTDCQTRYCEANPTYKDYRSFDTDGNCRVKILPSCSLSDM